jgi:hypothetical protein
MWLRVSRHRLVAIDSTRADSVQLKPITHSDAFGLYIRGHEEQIVLLGEDLDKAEAVFARIYDGLAAGEACLNLEELLD